MRLKFTDEKIRLRANLGLALNRRELAIATGYGYSTVRAWCEKGMPLIDGRITMRDAMAWRKRHEKAMRLESQSQIPTVLHHPLLTSGKYGVPA
jgi:hypothetical protein